MAFFQSMNEWCDLFALNSNEWLVEKNECDCKDGEVPAQPCKGAK
jgi:hypothetical protein